MAFLTTWRVVQGVEPARDTKKGDPQIKVRTDKGESINVSAAAANRNQIASVAVGDKIEISEPTDFNGTLYARLNNVEHPPAPKAASNGSARSWVDYHAMATIAHALAAQFEPTDATARAAILNTVMIAFSNGKVELPDDGPEGPPLGDDIPF